MRGRDPAAGHRGVLPVPGDAGFLFGEHRGSFLRIRASRGLTLLKNRLRVEAGVEFGLGHRKVRRRVREFGLDLFPVESLHFVIREVTRADVMRAGPAHHGACHAVADTEGESVLQHELIRDFLARGPVEIQFLERPVAVHDNPRDHAPELRESGGRGVRHPGVFSGALSVHHAGDHVMRPEEDTFGRCDGVRGFRAGVIEESRVPLLRHGGRNISVVASFRKKEPGAGLRVLRHDAADHFPDMETDRGYDAGEFHREINLRNLGRVKSVTPRPVKPEEV